MLRTNGGDWIEDEDGINEHIGDFFSGLFSCSGNRDFSEAFSVIKECITDEMNTMLIRAVSDEEIRTAAFQLGSLKSPGPDGYPGLFSNNIGLLWVME